MNPLGLFGGMADMAGSMGGQIWNSALGLIGAGHTWNEAQTANTQAQNWADTAASGMMANMENAAQHNMQSFNNYAGSVSPIAGDVAQLWQQNVASQGARHQDIMNQWGAINEDVANTRLAHDAANQERRDMAISNYQDAIARGTADVAYVQELGESMLARTEGYLNDAISDVTNTTGTFMKDASAQAEQGLDAQLNQIESDYQNGLLTPSEYRAAKRQAEFQTGQGMVDQQTKLMGQHQDKLVDTQMSAADTYGRVAAANQANNAQIRAQVGSNLAMEGQTLMSAMDDYVRGVMAGGQFQAEWGAAQAEAARFLDTERTRLQSGEAQAVTNAVMYDQGVANQLQQQRQQLVVQNEVNRNMALQTAANMQIAAAGFRMQNANQWVAALNNAAVNPANFTGWSASIQNAYALGDSGSSDGGGGGGFSAGGATMGAIGGGMLGHMVAPGVGGALVGGALGAGAGGAAGYLGG